MSRPSWFHHLYWTRLAKPVHERELFRQLLTNRIASLLEIGVGDGERMRRIARLVQLPENCASLRYVGTDPFESASDQRQHLSLKQAHRIASQLGLRASLIPGEPMAAIPRVAHKMGVSDLIIIDGGLNPQRPLQSAIGAWLNRLAHSRSIILATEESGGLLLPVDQHELRLATRIAA